MKEITIQQVNGGGQTDGVARLSVQTKGTTETVVLVVPLDLVQTMINVLLHNKEESK